MCVSTHVCKSCRCKELYILAPSSFFLWLFDFLEITWMGFRFEREKKNEYMYRLRCLCITYNQNLFDECVWNSGIGTQFTVLLICEKYSYIFLTFGCILFWAIVHTKNSSWNILKRQYIFLDENVIKKKGIDKINLKWNKKIFFSCLLIAKGNWALFSRKKCNE